MRMLAVDDEHLILENLMVLIRKIMPQAEIAGFTKSKEAFSYLSENRVDVALLDIEIDGMDGITLAKKCKDICPEMNIIFVTAYDKYTMEALRLHASGYLMKPILAGDLKRELENLRYPLPSLNTKRVRVQAFGNFEIFVDRKPLRLPMIKCKELLAYLIDRKGARITVSELACVLWENEPFSKRLQNNTYRVISDLMKGLREAGIEDIIMKNRKEIAINTEKIDCDYYRFLCGDVTQINAFRGEYMSNYAWSEFTLAGLENS